MLLDPMGRQLRTLGPVIFACCFAGSAWGQVAIALASGVAVPGSSINLNISVNTLGALPASIQWTITYVTSDIASITVTNGTTATNTAKTVSCNELSPGTIRCIVFGLNQNTTPNGVVAVAGVTIASHTTSTSTTLGLTGVVASSANGSPLITTVSGSNVTINHPVVTTAITVTTAPPGLQIVVDGSTLTAPQTFLWLPDSQHFISTPTPQGLGSPRYAFSTWSDGGSQSHTITTPSSASTYTANFTAQYLLTMTVNPAASGTIQASPASPDGFYNNGSVVQLSASPSPGFQFTSWSSGISTPAVVITGPVSITANFSSTNSCNYSLNRTTFSASSQGDFGRVQISTEKNCSWTASTSSQWLFINLGFTGTGNGYVGFTVAANPGISPRSSVLQIGGQSFVVTQANASCGSGVTFTNTILNPILAGGGELILNVSSPASCSWSTSLPPGWITVSAGSSGLGTGTVKLDIGANQTTSPRLATIQIGGSSLSITQLGTTTPQYYTDVPPSYLLVQNINLLVLNNILSGCTVTQFCPDFGATRAEAAPLLLKALFGDDFSYSPTPYFTDVPVTHQYFKYIQKMRELEITVGCTTTEYCPSSLVTRGQMAAFLIRAKLGGSGIPVAGGSTVSQSVYPLTPFFQDVPNSHIFFPFIQKIKQLGITFGCSLTEYCPENVTTRGQLAAFLTRGFLAP